MVQPIEIEITTYVGHDSDALRELGERHGLTGHALTRFAQALHMVRVTLLVSPETGSYAIKSFEDI